MPTYDYKCKDCGHEYELFQYMTDDHETTCPVCKGTVERLIGTGSGIIFKGSGFYETDYKRGESYKKAARKDSSDPKKDSSDKKASSSESKPSSSETKKKDK